MFGDLATIEDQLKNSAEDLKRIETWKKGFVEWTCAELMAREPKLAQYIQHKWDNNQWFVTNDAPDE